MANLVFMRCCGVKELNGISGDRSPEEVIRSLVHGGVWDSNFRFLIFTEAGSRSRYGKNLAKFITDNALGDVVKSSKGINPNSRRVLTVWTWNVDHAGVRKWIKENSG